MSVEVSIIVGTYFWPTIYIDQQDLFSLPSHKYWRLRTAKNNNMYVVLNDIRTNGNPQFMHRYLMKPKEGEFIDHKDGNGLNNSRENMRIATITQNNYNKSIHHNNKSGYKGVYMHESGRYRVCIFKDGKQIQGGYFTDKIEAAKKYNQLAILHFGEFAKLNKI